MPGGTLFTSGIMSGGTIFWGTLYTMMENMPIFTSWTVSSVRELGYDVKKMIKIPD